MRLRPSNQRDLLDAEILDAISGRDDWMARWWEIRNLVGPMCVRIAQATGKHRDAVLSARLSSLKNLGLSCTHASLGVGRRSGVSSVTIHEYGGSRGRHHHHAAG